MGDMKRRAARRHRATPEEVKQWVEAFRQSGLTRKEFAGRHGINLWTLRNWLQRFPKKGANRKAQGPDSLVELENPLPKQQAGPSSGRAYRIEMVDGTALELASGFAKQEVQDLVAILGRK